jgi:hypothetical protein
MKKVICFFIAFAFLVAFGTKLSMMLDDKYYGKGWRENRIAYAKKVKSGKKAWNGDTQTVTGPNGKEYEVRIIAYIPKIDDEPKLMVVHDKELDMFCYTNQNDPYYIVTGLNCFPGWYIRNEGIK